MMDTSAVSNSNRILGLLASAQLMSVLDFSIVSVALPSIQHEFRLAPAELQWIVSIYALLFGGFLLVGGRASDLFDRKVVFMLGLSLFTGASLLGGLAPSAALVLLARATQGLGAAILSPAALALLTVTFAPGPRRNHALGIFGSVASIGFTLGVILGGVLTSLLSWRWIFFVNVPLGLAALVAAMVLLPSSREEGPRQLDLAGAGLGTGAIASLVLALSQLGAPGTGSTRFIGFFSLALVLALCFILVERHSQHPLVPLSIFRIHHLSVANLLGLLTFVIGSLLAFVLPLYLQDVLGLTPLVIGLIFIPAGIGGMIGGQLATRVIRRSGLYGSAVTGAALMALGSLLMTRISPVEGAALVALGYMIAGIGIVCLIVTSTIAATAQLGAELQGLAAGMVNTAQQIGAALGASLASLVTSLTALMLGSSGDVAATTGHQAALYLALVVALLIGSLAILALRADPGVVEAGSSSS